VARVARIVVGSDAGSSPVRPTGVCVCTNSIKYFSFETTEAKRPLGRGALDARCVGGFARVVGVRRQFARDRRRGMTAETTARRPDARTRENGRPRERSRRKRRRARSDDFVGRRSEWTRGRRRGRPAWATVTALVVVAVTWGTWGEIVEGSGTCASGCGAAEGWGSCGAEDACACEPTRDGLDCGAARVAAHAFEIGDGSGMAFEAIDGGNSGMATTSAMVVDGETYAAIAVGWTDGCADAFARFADVGVRAWRGGTWPERGAVAMLNVEDATPRGWVGSCAHPRASASSSEGWAPSRGPFLVADGVHAYTVVNAWLQSSGELGFVISKRQANGGGTPEEHHEKTSAGYTADAAAIGSSGDLIVLATPSATSSRVKLLVYPSGDISTAGQGATVKEVGLPTLAAACSACHASRDGVKLTAAAATVISSSTSVLFAGRARVSALQDYPAIVRIDPYSQTTANGVEMYFKDASAIDEACEGASLASSSLGRYTAFTALAVMDEFAYVATSSVTHGGSVCGSACSTRVSCLYRVRSAFSAGDSALEHVRLYGSSGSLAKDAIAITTVIEEATSGGSVYILTTSDYMDSYASTSIVKVRVSGDSGCGSSCMTVTGTYLSASPMQTMTLVPVMGALFTVSRDSLGSRDFYRSLSFTEIENVSPTKGPVGGGTRILIYGVGFPYDASWTSDGVLAYPAACRFEHDGNPVYVHAVVVNSTAIECVTPSYAAFATTGSYVSEVAISFDGYPLAQNDVTFFDDSTWVGGPTYFMYYDVPHVRETKLTNSPIESALYTGEAPDGQVAVLALDGGLFLRGSISCRFDSVSVVPGTYVNSTRILCPLCVADSGGSCGGYHAKLSWLANPVPSSVSVEFSMNGVDYHPGRSLTFHKPPDGVEVSHERVNPSDVAYESTADSGATTMTLDPITVRLIDSDGTRIADDYGVGGTRGFTITASLNTQLSPDTTGITMTTSPSSVVTVDGVATLQLVFSAPLAIGEYYVNIIGADCTGTSCINLSVDSTFQFTVIPGAPDGLVVVPGTSNPVTLPADLQVDLGEIDVFVVDAAGNRLYDFDESTYSVSVQSVDASNNARATGSTLQGTTTLSTTKGRVTFDDLSLVNPAPLGGRIPGNSLSNPEMNNLTYAAPSRGVNGADAVYRFLFTASFGSALSVFTTVNGQPRYLEIDSHSIPQLVTGASTATVTSSITVKLYDAGNNLLSSHDPNAKVYVGKYPVNGDEQTDRTLSTATEASVIDVGGTATWNFAANSITLNTQPAGFYRIGFYLQGSEYIQPALQLVEMTPGQIGHHWLASLETGLEVRYAGASTPLGDLTVYVADSTGSAVGSGDRCDGSTLSNTVERTFACTSSTLTMSGTLSGDTAGTGAFILTGVILSNPTIGTHTITCTSTGITLKDSSNNVVATSCSNSLADVDFVFSVTAGVYTNLQLVNSPESAYMSSFGVMNISNFRSYAADYYVPLDVFEVQVFDAYSNEVTYSSDNLDTAVQLSYVSGAGETLGVLSYYLTFNGSIADRDAIVVVDPYAIHSSGLTPSFGVSNRARFAGLALKQSKVGTHTLSFTVPAIPSLTAVTQTITVTLGKGHHLGVRAPCDDYYASGDTCTEASRLSRGNNVKCTCTQYGSAEKVELGPIYLYVMDGGDNLLGSNYEPMCRPEESSCTGKIEAVFDVKRSKPCVGTGTTCDATQPEIHSKSIDANGEAIFDDIIFQFPESTLNTDPIVIKFRSLGLVDVDLPVEIWPGSAHALDVSIPSTFEGLAERNGLPSATFTPIARSTAPFVVNVVDRAGNKLTSLDTSSHAVTVSVTGGTADVDGTLTASTSAGTVVFQNFYFTAPSRQTHTIEFATTGLVSYQLPVKVVEGAAFSLKHVDTIETVTTYVAADELRLEKFTVQIQDAGGGMLESNTIARQVTATIRSTFDSNAVLRTDTLYSAVKSAPLGKAELYFKEISVKSLESGIYSLTFTSLGLVSDSVNFTVTPGGASQLYAPVVRGYPNVDSTQYTRPSTVTAARVVDLDSFPVTVTDGGGNELAESTVQRLLDVSVVYATTTSLTVFSAEPQISSPYTVSGVALVPSIRLFDPIAGRYNITVGTSTCSTNSGTCTAVLKSYTFQFDITLGDVSSLDACGCPGCVRAAPSVAYPSGLCIDSREYSSADEVQLRDIFVVTRDAGGLLMGSSYNTIEPRRAISVELKTFTPVNGQAVELNVLTSPLLADDAQVDCSHSSFGCQNVGSVFTRQANIGAMYVTDGVAAWCADGVVADKAKAFCRPANSDATSDKVDAEAVYFRDLNGQSAPDITGTLGYGLDFYGARTVPGFVGNASGLVFSRPLAGRYVLQFTSNCDAAVCPNTTNAQLTSDSLEITVTPGVPHRLEFAFAQSLPTSYDSNVTFPTFDVVAYDVAGNLIPSSHMNVTVNVTPNVLALFGASARLQNGSATFDSLKLIGRRGVAYDLTFTIGAATLAHTGVTLFPCSQIKPHSATTDDGSCECFPGYTEDVETSGSRPNMTSVSRFAELYRQADPWAISAFSASLRPYGVCVPCGPGYFKSIPGAAACTACPSLMDTFTDENGSPKAEHESLSGEMLPGYLANVDKSACECTLLGEPEGEATAFVQYYRLEPHDSYECAPCPEGAVCDSRDVTKLSLLENRWRQNTTTLAIFDCPSSYSCKGGVGAADELCNVGYAGPVCGRCDSAAGYAVLEDSQALESSLQCTKCWPNAAVGFSVFLIAVAQIFVAWIILKAAASNVVTSIVYVKVILSHFHMLSVVGTINLGWPRAVGIIFPIARIVSTSSTKTFATDCISKWTHIQYTSYYFGTIGIFAAASVPYYLYLRVRRYKAVREEWYSKKRDLEAEYISARREGENVDRVRRQLERMKRPPEFTDPVQDAYALDMDTVVDDDGYIVQEWTDEELAELEPTSYDVAFGAFIALSLYLCWLPIVTNSLQMIRSTTLKDIGSFLYVDYNIQTDVGAYSRSMATFLVFGVIIGAGLPYYLFKALKTHSSQLHWSKTKARYGFFYIGFSKERCYWEFVVLIRKLLLVLTSSLLPDAPLLAIYISIGILQGFLALVFLLKVYENEQHQKVEVASLVTALITYNCGALMATVKRDATSSLGAIAIYVLNLAFVFLLFSSVRGDINAELVAAKMENARAELDEEEDYRREAVKKALVDTHKAARALHPRMAENLIDAFDDDTLIDELTRLGANDLKLKHLQLSVHLESLRNKWRKSKSGMVDPYARKEHEIEVLALERKKKAIDRERWRRRMQTGEGFSEDERASQTSEEERKSLGSDDSAFVERESSVEARIAQYNELIAQQLRRTRAGAKDADNAEGPTEPVYPADYVPSPPRLPALDSVSWVPPSAEIMLYSPTKPSPKKQLDPSSLAAKKPSKPPTSDPFTYDYFELTPMRDALPNVDEPLTTTTTTTIHRSADARASKRPSWRERMADSRSRVAHRIAKRENHLMTQAFNTIADDDNAADGVAENTDARTSSSSSDSEELEQRHRTKGYSRRRSRR